MNSVHFSYERRSYVLTANEIVIHWGNIWFTNSSIIPTQSKMDDLPDGSLLFEAT
ncbi:hypothetical protein [Paenibacillus alvei]|uniref:hypothetical protein n=1 Tax=Paenibacillus alvei TaxID=44250 RepID=UPI0018CDAB8C|nr:hypothetical protein [Paenibacillus alvei]MCY9579130.1 hypothetical protein [Paenibacillus alvei]MCY9583557.1 hypothetical protein [Paenibacillus alvei]